MISLLLKTRLKYYRNYIRYHFDRTTKIEIALIFLVFLLLILRSPADIGYNFKWMRDEHFNQYWANIFSIFLPIFYLLSEAFAIYTLRPSGEWQLLGALPFSRRSITHYYLFRHFSKAVILMLIGCLPFWFALTNSLALRVLRFSVALGILFVLQLSAFQQAYRLRFLRYPFWQRITRWLLPEVFIVGLLSGMVPWLRFVFSASLNIILFGLLLLWIGSLILLKYIEKNFTLRDVENKIFRKAKSVGNTSISSLSKYIHGFRRAFIIQDILYLWRQKRSSFLLPVFGSLIATTICIAEDEVSAVYVGLFIVEVLFCFFLIKTIMILFEKDVAIFGLIKSIAVTAIFIWWTRWLVICGLIGIPIVIPILIIPIKFGINLKFILFVMASLFAIPSVLATLCCNAGFGLFPHTNLSANIIIISIILMVLFWFFMPFGTLFILAVLIFWIRKSQRHLQYLELL